MNTYKYKEISKEDALQLSLEDKLYLKEYGTGKYYEYKCISKQHSDTVDLATYMGNDKAFFLANCMKQDEFFSNYGLYIKIPAYSATEIMQKIENEELKDDDILIDKNGTEDSIYDVLEQDISALLDYAPYQIKENKYVKFEEAKNSNKKFKYKTWEHFYTLIEVYEDLLQKNRQLVNEMMEGKAWEIEE